MSTSINYFRSQLLSYRPERALKTMGQMPSFGKALQATVHRVVQKEVEAAARSFGDPPLKEFTRADLMAFDAGKLFKKQLKEAPIMMTTLIAASTNQKFDSINVGELMSLVLSARLKLLPNFHPCTPRSRLGLGSAGRREASRWT